MTTRYREERRKTTAELTEESVNMLIKALRAENALAIEDGIARATGNHVLGKMCRQGVFYAGKSELPDGWIHKAKPEWLAEIGASRRQVDTANKKGAEWRLFEYEPGYRPRCKRPTGLYKFDAFRIMELAFPAKLEELETELRYLEPDAPENAPAPPDKGSEDGRNAHHSCPERTAKMAETGSYGVRNVQLTEEVTLENAREDAVECNTPTPEKEEKTSSQPSNGDDVPQPRYFESLLTGALEELKTAGEEVGTPSPQVMKKRGYGEKAKAAVEGGAATEEEIEAAMRRIAARSADIWLYFDAALKDVRKEKSGAGRRGSPPDLVEAFRVNGMDRAAAVAERHDLMRYGSLEEIPYGIWKDMAGSDAEWFQIGSRVYRYVEDERRRAEKRETAA